MKKFLLTSFLPLCILLLSGYNQLYGHAYRGAIRDSPSKLSERLEQTVLATAEISLPLIKKLAVSDSDDKTLLIDATEVREEEEEHELIPCKRNRETSSYFSAIFCALTRGYLFSYTREILSFCKHFSDVSSNRRHLVFQVFLI
jgi:hypothetical protein